MFTSVSKNKSESRFENIKSLNTTGPWRGIEHADSNSPISPINKG